MTSLSPEEAGNLLNEARQAASDMRNRIANSVVGPILIVWGIVWTTCFSITVLGPSISGWAWLIGDSAGFAGTFVLWRRNRNRGATQGEGRRIIGRRLFWSWLLLFVFADIWIAIAWPMSGQQFGAFLVTAVMFAYVLMGLWLEMRFLFWLGLGVTAVVAGGYLAGGLTPLLPALAPVTGGLALLASGIYLNRARR